MKGANAALLAVTGGVVILLLVFSTLIPAPEETRLPAGSVPPNAPSMWPQGTATPSETCGACHQAIYREFTQGFGSDLKFAPMIYSAKSEKPLSVPAPASTSATAHALAGVDPFPIHARGVEEKGHSCNSCHFPQAFEIPDPSTESFVPLIARPNDQEAGGLTCASCHLTPEGKIRGPYAIANAPHPVVQDARMQSAVMCASCHALGKRVIGKQTQTFLEWRDDFSRPGLGVQQCQSCHMPRTMRKVAEAFDPPLRAVARHLWTGGHSAQRLKSALQVVPLQPENGRARFEFHVINIGAGHSVPTGSNRRAVYLRVKIFGKGAGGATAREWMFAPSYGDRPDDRAFLEEDKTRPDATAAIQADSQGPHETTIRAGEERVLTWEPKLKPGTYRLETSLIYDLNRYNDPTFTGDQTELYDKTQLVIVTSSSKENSQ